MKLRITVHGVPYEVEVEVLDAGDGFPPPSALPNPNAVPGAAPPRPAAVAAAPSPPPAPGASDEHVLLSPVPGTVQEICCQAGDVVAAGQELVVLDAMKMRTCIAAQHDGTVQAIKVAVGDGVREGQALVEFQ